MSGPAISLDQVAKQYHRTSVRSGDLRRTVMDSWKWWGRKDETFYALRDITLSIPEGETVGIIGPNGAGKSTLLKLLSRITFPSEGTIRIRGRLASMLEIGTGFHPELTGRENIFLNGALLGMKRREVQTRLESIVSFSGLEPFIDTPVKHYSSGMYTRLAFSVASHLEPDILLLDEVLAVGDLAFKRQSLERLQEVSVAGSTILMVSHQLSYLRSFCQLGIYLDHGRVMAYGPFDDVADQYVASLGEVEQKDPAARPDRKGNGIYRLQNLRILDQAKHPLEILHCGQNVSLHLDLVSHGDSIAALEIRLDVFDMTGRQWFVMNNMISNGMMTLSQHQVTIACHVPRWPLNEGQYYIDVTILNGNDLSDHLQHAVTFIVEKGWFYPTGMLPNPVKGVLIEYDWKVVDPL